MPVRRHADPNNVQYIWDSIKSAKYQRHVADLPSITKFLQSEANCSSTQAELYISQTLKDGLIVKYDSKTQKYPSDYYRMPTDELTTPYDDGKDWYCIECHLAGDVTPCKYCHRVFHAECSQNVRHKQIVFQCVEKLYYLPNTTMTNDSIVNTSNTANGILNETASNSNVEGDESEDISKVDDPSDENMKIDIPMEDNGIPTGFIYDDTICSICNLHRVEDKSELDTEELNHLLGFILQRIRSWLPSNLTHTMAPGQKYEWNDDADLSWRAAQLFYQHMDMNVMELKLQSKEYTKLIEFMADVITIQHNVAIFHGIESQEYGAAELMIRDTCHDVTEVKTCIDCYKHSNEKINSKWFCLPCRKPHQLVWAKQKGYPFWPAKIIKETGGTYDVRFFGGKYERSLLQKNKKNILPIETKLKNHEIKKSAAFNKALEELKLHQHLLKNPNLIAKYTDASAKKEIEKSPKRTPSTIRSNMKTAKPTNVEQNLNIQESQPVEQVRKNVSGIKKKPVKRRTLTPQQAVNKSRRTSVHSDNKQPATKSTVQEIIPISDAEEDEFVSLNNYNLSRSNDGCYGQVSSSTEYCIASDDGFHAQEATEVMHPLEQPYSDAVEKMRRKLEQAKDKKLLISTAMDCMQQEIDRITNDHNEHLKKLYEAHQTQISETKKKQWCYNCEQDAIYHCCWNTAYCSPTCQQQHWQAEHKKVCRRKR